MEACQPDKDGMFSHRVAKEKYGLEEVLNKRVPAYISMIIDSSGSMYGEGLKQAQHFVQEFTSTNLRSKRKMSLYTHPEGRLGKPSNESAQIQKDLKKLIPIGFSNLSIPLRLAKEDLKGRSGVVILVSDGHITALEEVKKACTSLHRNGNIVFVIGVGTDKNEDVLKSLCAHPQYYRPAERGLDVSKYLIKLLVHQ